MNNNISLGTVRKRLSENNLRYEELKLNPTCMLIVLQRGGRILGPFFENIEESIFWINDAFQDDEKFKFFIVDEKNWNTGGERIWLAPELLYNVRDRNDFFNSYDLQTSIDPGNYIIKRAENNTVGLNAELNPATIGNDPKKRKKIRVERSIHVSENPLRFDPKYEGLMESVTYAGYSHKIASYDKSQDSTQSEIWSLIQLNPGGKIIIPCSPNTPYTDYYQPVGDLLERNQYSIKVPITGKDQYKVGFKPPYLNGKMGYFYKLNQGQYCLLVRFFPNNPDNDHVEEPYHTIGNRGHNIHIYNDDESFGGFGEMEICGHPFGGANPTVSRDEMSLYCFVGSIERLNKISIALLGTD